MHRKKPFPIILRFRRSTPVLLFECIVTRICVTFYWNIFSSVSIACTLGFYCNLSRNANTEKLSEKTSAVQTKCTELIFFGSCQILLRRHEVRFDWQIKLMYTRTYTYIYINSFLSHSLSHMTQSEWLNVSRKMSTVYTEITIFNAYPPP